MSGADVYQGPYCTALGCRGNRADVVIKHPEHGERVVCEDHINGHEVLREVPDA